MKTIAAVIRKDFLEDIVDALEDMGIRGMTITDIRGIGEEKGVSLYKPYRIHNRIEIVVADERVDEVVSVIGWLGKTGLAGDGIIGVYPMDYMIKIRTGEKAAGNRYSRPVSKKRNGRPPLDHVRPPLARIRL